MLNDSDLAVDHFTTLWELVCKLRIGDQRPMLILDTRVEDTAQQVGEESLQLIESLSSPLPGKTSTGVKGYHEWMKSEELQTLTASEPLSLEEEYQMQQSWREDDNKCTFIILDKERYEANGNDEIECMVGDVNLFFNDEDSPSTAEIEIMIAESIARGRGLGKEALCCMMRYGFEDLNLTEITAKIGYSNKPSVNMFMNIGFQEISRSDVFEEITFELKLNIDIKEKVRTDCCSYRLDSYR